MKKPDLLSKLKTPGGITLYEKAMLERFDLLLELLADLRNITNNGKDG